MKNPVSQNQRDRIALNTTIHESAVGRNLAEAANNLLAEQAEFFEGIARFEIISARRISTSFRVQYAGHQAEMREVWEFEVFTHSESL